MNHIDRLLADAILTSGKTFYALAKAMDNEPCAKTLGNIVRGVHSPTTTTTCKILDHCGVHLCVLRTKKFGENSAKCNWPSVQELERELAAAHAEIERLKRGDFTQEEFQNLCHGFDESDECRFLDGCRDYQRKLFGRDQDTTAEQQIPIDTPPAARQ